METILSLLDQYGVLVYFILFFYCALKSGWLPLFAGYAAYLQALDVYIVALATLMGGYLGDEIRFFVARRYGNQWLASSKTLNTLYKTAKILIDKYGTGYIFIYRYPKGLRTIGALQIGLTSIRWKKFTFLNFSSASLWVMVMVGGGYVFGETFDRIGIENLTAVSILLLIIFSLSLWQLWRKEKETALNKTSTPSILK